MIIWISSYPRSGNTFLRTLLKICLGQDTYSIYNDEDIGGDSNLADVTGHRNLEHCFGDPGFDLSPLRTSEELFFLKTHEPSRALVMEADKVIYVIRDGREATLSYHKYLLAFHDMEVSPSELLMGLDFPIGSWSDHVSGWEPKRKTDTLLLFFEEFTVNPIAAVNKIAEFCALPVINNSILKFKDLQAIDSRFFRQGKHDSYQEELSETAETLFWIRSYLEMRDYGYLRNLPRLVEELSEEVLLIAQAGLREGISYVQRLQSQLTQELDRSKLLVQEYRSELRILREEVEHKDK